MDWIFIATSKNTIGQFITWRGNSALNCTWKPMSGFKCNLARNSLVRKRIFFESHNRRKIRKNENSYNLVCFYPGRAPQKAISKSTLGTFIALANRKQGQSYTFKSSTTLVFPVLVFAFVFKLFNKLHTISRIIDVFHWV